MTFFNKLTAAIKRNNSLICVGLDPTPEGMPSRYYSNTATIVDSLLQWNQAVIEATKDAVCCYKPNIAFYEALGSPGMDLLRKTLAFIPDDIPVILDVKRGDIGSTATAYARACFEEFSADAVTLNPYLGWDSIAPFAAYKDKGMFVLCHSSNSSANEFQTLPVPNDQGEEPLFVRVARIATNWSERVGLVVGATYPDALKAVRIAAPDAWILAPGVGAQNGDLKASLTAGLRSDGSGLIISVTRSVTHATNHREVVQSLRSAVNAVQKQIANADQSDPRSLILALFDLGAVQFGTFTLSSGIQSPIYIDLRLLISQPDLLAQAARGYASILQNLSYDRIAGVPYAALPIGTAIALTTGVPLIYPRKEIKQHGLGKDIEGHWKPGDRVVIIEDLITSGGSTIETAERLRAAGLIVQDVIVFIDREQGGIERLAANNIRAHSLLRLSEVLAVLEVAGRINGSTHQNVRDFIDNNQPKRFDSQR